MSSFSCNRFALSLAGAVAAVCAALTPSSAVSAVSVETSLPSFACYEASFSAFRPSNARIADQFGKRDSPVAAATTICAEASVNSRAKPALPLHLACHAITDHRPTPLGVRIQSWVGTEQLSLGAGQTLCTPASITTSGALAAPPAGIDAFTCYTVRVRAAAAKTVTVADEFGPTEDALGALTSVCAPASVDGSSTLLHKKLLACYRLSSNAAAPAVIVRSRLGLLKASTGLRRQLCVPSNRV